MPVTITTAMIIPPATVIRSAPAPPSPKRPRINIHIRVNRRALFDGGGSGLGWGFVDRGYQRIQDGIACTVILQSNNLVGGQGVAAAGGLDLVHRSEEHTS